MGNGRAVFWRAAGEARRRSNLEQRVNKRGQAGAGKENQQRKAKKQNDHWQQPPLLVRFDKLPKVGEKTSAALRVRCFFKRTA
jgi:hypothetical protein